MLSGLEGHGRAPPPHSPNYLLSPRSVNFRQHFRNLSRKTVPLRYWGVKAVNREDKRFRRYRDRDFAKFERSRRYRDR